MTTAGSTLFALYEMNTKALDLGIGIAMVGVITFCGTLIASSIFEEHRHDHSKHSKKKGELVIDKSVPDEDASDIEELVAKKNQEKSTTTRSTEIEELKKLLKKQKDTPNFLETFFAGKGIMRKAIASSIIITYIVIIGVYADNGELDSLIAQETSSVNATSADADPTKRVPKSLLDHFTVVVSIIIVFYFSADVITKYIGAGGKKDDKAKKALLKLLDSGDLTKIGIDKNEEKEIRKIFEESK